MVKQPKDGYPDFYINNSLHWMVEILREGIDMKEHAKWFKPNGKYSMFLKSASNWALIDIRSEQKTVRAHYENMWHIKYAKDFSYYKILYPNGDQTKIMLMGGK